MKRREQVDDRFDVIKSFERSRQIVSRNAIISDNSLHPIKLNKKVLLFLSRKSISYSKEETQKSIDKIECSMKR